MRHLTLCYQHLSAIFHHVTQYFYKKKKLEQIKEERTGRLQFFKEGMNVYLGIPYALNFLFGWLQFCNKHFSFLQQGIFRVVGIELVVVVLIEIMFYRKF